MSIIIGRRSSNSLRDPCPYGFGIGYMDVTFNTNISTVLVICDRSFPSKKVWSDADILGLGLGIGLGVPIFMILYVLLLNWYNNRFNRYTNKYNDYINNRTNTDNLRPVTINPPPPPPPPTQEKQLEHVITLLKNNLTTEAFSDFQNRHLSDTLKEHLSRLRIREGRDLNDVVMYAKYLDSIEIENFVMNLNPTVIYIKEHHIT